MTTTTTKWRRLGEGKKKNNNWNYCAHIHNVQMFVFFYYCLFSTTKLEKPEDDRNRNTYLEVTRMLLKTKHTMTLARLFHIYTYIPNKAQVRSSRRQLWPSCCPRHRTRPSTDDIGQTRGSSRRCTSNTCRDTVRSSRHTVHTPKQPFLRNKQWVMNWWWIYFNQRKNENTWSGIEP